MLHVDKIRKVMYAHRISYELAYGAIPPGCDVMHSCDNPPCCNPAHLSTGTRHQNMMDASSRSRWPAPSTANWRRGESHHGAKLTEDSVRQIRARVAAGEAHRSVAPDYGVSARLVGLIVARKNWAHVA